jgi:ribose transport system ATP-binding protein
MSIRDNMVSANLKGVSRGIWFDNAKGEKMVQRYIRQLKIKTPDVNYLKI